MRFQTITTMLLLLTLCLALFTGCGAKLAKSGEVMVYEDGNLVLTRELTKDELKGLQEAFSAASSSEWDRTKTGYSDYVEIELDGVLYLSDLVSPDDIQIRRPKGDTVTHHALESGVFYHWDPAKKAITIPSHKR